MASITKTARSLGQINQTYKNVKRLRQILTVLAKHGFSQAIDLIGLTKYLPFIQEPEVDLETSVLSERLRLVCEDLGPSFIKLGQMLGSRQDLVGPEIAKSFQKLKDDVGPAPFDEVRELIETDLGGELEDLFSHFEEEPFAAASISQVHQARIIDEEGEPRRIVVKVQRPGIERQIQTDLSILYSLAKLGSRYIPELASVRPVMIAEEFSQVMRSATDFIEEAHHIDEMFENFETREEIVIPKIYWERTSKRVLTMEKIPGKPLHTIENQNASKETRKRICQLGVEAFFAQIFTHGLFHADLHSGNILVIREGVPEGREKIGFIDFGEVGRLGSNAQKTLASLFGTLLAKDYRGFAQEYIQLGTLQEPIDISQFADDLEKKLGPLIFRKGQKAHPGKLLAETASVASKYHLRLPREFVLLGRVLFTMETSFQNLDSDFDLFEYGKSLAGDLVQKELNPEKMAREFFWNVKGFSDVGKDLPLQIKFLLQKLTKNQFTTILDIRDLKKVTQSLDRAANRVSFAIVIAGLVIGSSFLTMSQNTPRYLNMPVFGIVGYLIAGFLGLWLLVNILRSRKF